MHTDSSWPATVFIFLASCRSRRMQKSGRARRASALQDKLILLSAGMEPAHDRKHDRGH
jgi:hypothetical protein